MNEKRDPLGAFVRFVRGDEPPKRMAHRPLQALHQYEHAKGLTEWDCAKLRVMGINPDA